MFFVEEQCHGEIPYLLLRILVGGDEVDGLQMAEVDIPSEYIDVQELRTSQRKPRAQSVHFQPSYLADVFLLVVAAQVSVCAELAIRLTP